MSPIKGVIFDLDGTLIDSLDAYTYALNQGLALFGLGPVSKDQLRPFMARAAKLEDILAELYPCCFQEQESRLKCRETVLKAYLQSERDTVKLMPLAREILTWLKDEGFKVGIFTARAASGDGKWRELRLLGIDKFIDTVVTSAEAARKPAPDGVIKCLRELGLAADECVLVGDSLGDIIAGKAAGVTTIAISSGWTPAQLLYEAQPDVVIGNLAELQARLSREMMPRSEGKAEYQDFFKFAAKAGSLEGYLFQREQIEDLTNWVGNIESMYRSLPDAVRREINGEFSLVLGKVLTYGDKVLTPEIKARLEKLQLTASTK